MRFFAIFIITIAIVSLSSCEKYSHDSIITNNSSAPDSSSINIDASTTFPEVKTTNSDEMSPQTYEVVTNENFPDIQQNLVGDPMEEYFYSDKYKTKSDPESNNPIYSDKSFIKGKYPLDETALDYESARVIIIQFKEIIDENCLLSKDKPVVTIVYGKKGKDMTDAYNFTFDIVSQKLLITKKSAGLGFGSGTFTEITVHGNNLRTAEIEGADIRYDDGREEHIEGQRSRQLSGLYTFQFYT